MSRHASFLAFMPSPSYACALVVALFVLTGCSHAIGPMLPVAAGDSVRTEQVAPGVRHEYRWEAAGPWAIHVAAADLGRCGVGVGTVKALDRLAGREKTSVLGARLGARSGRPVDAIVNGDFFSLRAPQGVPLGAQVTGGEMLHGGTGRPVFGVTIDGRPWFGNDRLVGSVRGPHGEALVAGHINDRPDSSRVMLYNRFVGDLTPTDTGVIEVIVRVATGARAAGDTTVGVVLAIDTAAAGVALPAGVVVLAGRGRMAASLRATLAVGDTVRWAMHFADAPAPVTEVIAGSAQLLRGGASLAPFTGAAAIARHPRTAVGVTKGGTLLLVTVDGRQASYSAGMTLAELTALMLRLGATGALNLDGGGSTAMVIEGRVVNRPSDPTGERAVGNALAILGPTPGSCR